MRPFFYLLVGLFIASLLLRIFLFPPQTRQMPEGKKIHFVATIESTPKHKGNLQTFLASVKGYEPVLITAPSVPRLSYGQKIEVAGILQTIVLDDKKPLKTSSFPVIRSVKEQGWLFTLRSNITYTFEAYLPTDLGRLLLGIVFGIKEPLSSSFEDQIRSVGLLHVIAASGMNITLLAGALVVILEKVFSRKKTIGITLLLLFVYAAFAGFQPSIVRAAIMGSLALFAGLVGKQYFGLWALCVTGYVMLMVDPSLLSNVGFQLSFLATLGIMLIKPVLQLSFPKILKPLEEDLTTTFSAQVATTPILLATFGQVSLISLVVNALILWTIPPLMILGGLAAILSLIFEPLAALFLYLCLPLLWIFKAVTELFAGIPFPLQIEDLPGWYVIIYYMALCILIYKVRKKKKHE